MINTTTLPAHHVYFENPIGRLLEHPTGLYTSIEYYQGPRQFNDLLAFLTHAGQLLARWGWDTLVGYSQRAMLPELTAEEANSLATHWRMEAPHSLALLYGAQLLPHEVFARLSWMATTPVTNSF